MQQDSSVDFDSDHGNDPDPHVRDYICVGVRALDIVVKEEPKE